MRTKEPKILLTFKSTTDAIAAEDYFMENQVPGRIIPVPREISASCGLAWCSPVAAAGELNAAQRRGLVTVEGSFELML